ncbi:MAG: hypothetical protein F6J90_12225 [Moorea sp. SIOASIH]|uniref:hypothetical protein n=1 Tax=Moorena sp. SIOASIH TaxID=2607817 RepID=UPI0013B99844|nr:hypothetical protein [Moorena sp. SIOASIH]NEO37036.1 hypothetical protein [Moorena sp. SIOASIH]
MWSWGGSAPSLYVNSCPLFPVPCSLFPTSARSLLLINDNQNELGTSSSKMEQEMSVTTPVRVCRKQHNIITRPGHQLHNLTASKGLMSINV